MGNVVSYFLAKPEAGAMVRGNVEDKKIEDAAENLEEKSTQETSTEIDNMKIEDANEGKDTVTNISEDDFEVIKKGKTHMKELEQENEKNCGIIKLKPEDISKSNEEDVLCPGTKEETPEIMNKTTGSLKDIHKELAKLEKETIPETAYNEKIEVIGSIQNDKEATPKPDQEIELLQTAEQYQKISFEQDNPNTNKTVQDITPETPHMDTDPLSETVGKEGGCEDLAMVLDIQLIGSIENDCQDTVKEDDRKSLERPVEEGTEESLEGESCNPERKDSFSKIIEDCKIEVENIQNNMVGLGKEIFKKDITSADECSCPNPELSKLGNDRDNFCGLTNTTMTFLVDESGKTMNQLVYDLSEEHYGFEVMKESSVKYSDENLCTGCSCECDLDTAGGDLDKKFGPSGSTPDTESSETGEEQTSNYVKTEIMFVTSESKEQTMISKRELEGVPEVETIGSIQDCESEMGEVGSMIEESKIFAQNLAEAKTTENY